MKLYPPLLVLLAICGQIIIGQWVPIEPVLAVGWQLAGILFVVVGMASILLMSRTFVKAETTILPDCAPSILLESGLFAYSRNPIYVCMALILTGSGLLSGHIWSLLFVPLFNFAVYRLWILQEEQNLEAEFGQEYRDYKQRVRRWL